MGQNTERTLRKYTVRALMAAAAAGAVYLASDVQGVSPTADAERDRLSAAVGMDESAHTFVAPAAEVEPGEGDNLGASPADIFYAAGSKNAARAGQFGVTATGEVHLRQIQIFFEKGADRGVIVDAIAEQLGADVRATRFAGVGLVELPEGVQLRDAMGAIQAMEGVTARTNPVMRGAGLGSSSLEADAQANLSYQPYSPIDHAALDFLQWQFNDTAYQTGSWYTSLNRSKGNDVVVALLDSGVSDAPSIACTERVAPYDFVEGDAVPQDAHGHGTHIASMIAANPECGAPFQGYAPKIRLMPLRVLDKHLAGTELALAEAIMHAVDNGADVINMSLSFGKGYLPGPVLQEALFTAATKGVVMVGSTGNAGQEFVGYPAASPLVIAVGAYDSKGESLYDRTEYSNYGASVDVLAPGGSLEDYNEDGLPDAMLGEAPSLEHEGEFELKLSAGTSQAAAAVTGLAALLIAEGHDGASVPAIVSASATRPDGYSHETGSGLLNPGHALAFLDRADVPEVAQLKSHFQVSPVLAIADGDEGRVIQARVAVRVSDPTHGSLSLKDAGIEAPVVIRGHWTGAYEGTDGCEVQPEDGDCVFTVGIDKTVAGTLAGFEVDTVTTLDGTVLEGFGRPAATFYGLNADWAEALEDQGSTDALFEMSAQNEEAAALFPEVSLEPAWLYRPLGLTGALAPSAWIMDEAFFEAIVEEEATGDGLGSSSHVMGLGPSSLIFSFSRSLIFPTLPAFEDATIIQGNGLGSSSLDFSEVMGLGSSSLIFSGVDSMGFLLVGNGLGSSSLDFSEIMGLGPSSLVYSQYTSMFVGEQAVMVGNGLGSSSLDPEAFMGLGPSSLINEGAFLTNAYSEVQSGVSGLTSFYGSLTAIAEGNGLGSSSLDFSEIMGLGPSSLTDVVYALYAGLSSFALEGNGLGSSSIDWEAVMGLGPSSLDAIFLRLFAPELQGNGLGSSSLPVEAVMGLGPSSHLVQVLAIMYSVQAEGNGLGSSSISWSVVPGVSAESQPGVIFMGLGPSSAGMIGNGLGSSSLTWSFFLGLDEESSLLDLAAVMGLGPSSNGNGNAYGAGMNGNGLGSSSIDFTTVMGLGPSSYVFDFATVMGLGPSSAGMNGNGLGSSSINWATLEAIDSGALDFNAVMGLGPSSVNMNGNGLGSSSIDWSAVMGLGPSSLDWSAVMGLGPSSVNMIGNGLGSSSLDWETVMGLGPSSLVAHILVPVPEQIVAP